MADKKDDAKQQALPEPAKTDAPAKKGKATTFAIFGGVMLVEGAAIFAGMEMLGHEPDPTAGMEPLAPTSKPWQDSLELPIAAVRVPHNNGARTLLYSVQVAARGQSKGNDEGTEV